MRQLLLAAALGLGLCAPAWADGPVLPHGRVILQGLDKITARITPLEVPLDTPVRFGTLEILARACLETPPTEPPESAAFLQIRVIDPGSEPVQAFSGWMFASSPSISALEHPVYEIWVTDCAEPQAPAEEAPSLMPITPPQNG